MQSALTGDAPSSGDVAADGERRADDCQCDRPGDEDQASGGRVQEVLRGESDERISGVLIALGLVWFSQISVHGSYVADILGPSLLAGLGLGFAFVPVTIAAVAGVSDSDSGLASGLINTSQQVGGAVGLAVLAAVATSVTGSSRAPAALTNGFQEAFLTGAGFAVLGVFATLLLIRTSDSRAHVELGQGPAADHPASA